MTVSARWSTPVQSGYGRALISAVIQGASMGLVFSVLLTLTGDSFTSVALRYVPLSVAVFVLWQMYILRRNRGIRYPMRTEAIPSRTVMYALPEYAQDARRVLGAHPRFRRRLRLLVRRQPRRLRRRVPLRAPSR